MREKAEQIYNKIGGMREKAEKAYNKIGDMREKAEKAYNKIGDMREKAEKAYNKIGGLNTIAILFLILLIPLISIICPQVSLSGLSTFGLLIVALQALSFTKEQSLEWRRKGAYDALRSAEILLEKHSTLINGYLTASQDNKSPETIFEQIKRATKKSTEDYDVFDGDMIEATEKLLAAENHLTTLGKKKHNGTDRPYHTNQKILYHH